MVFSRWFTPQTQPSKRLPIYSSGQIYMHTKKWCKKENEVSILSWKNDQLCLPTMCFSSSWQGRHQHSAQNMQPKSSNILWKNCLLYKNQCDLVPQSILFLLSNSVVNAGNFPLISPTHRILLNLLFYLNVEQC